MTAGFYNKSAKDIRKYLTPLHAAFGGVSHVSIDKSPSKIQQLGEKIRRHDAEHPPSLSLRSKLSL